MLIVCMLGSQANDACGDYCDYGSTACSAVRWRFIHYQTTCWLFTALFFLEHTARLRNCHRSETAYVYAYGAACHIFVELSKPAFVKLWFANSTCKEFAKVFFLMLSHSSSQYLKPQTFRDSTLNFELRSPNCGPLHSELRASDAHTAADTLKSNSGLEAGFTATQDWLACCPMITTTARVHSDLGWGEHVTHTAGKAWRALHFVMRVLRKGSDKSKEIAYKSLVRPVMEYGAACWDPCRLEHIKTLEKIQKRALKCCRKNSPLKWDTLTDRRTRIRLCALFKTYRGEPVWREIKNRLQPPNYSSRNDHSYKLRERRQRTDTGKFSFLNRTIRDWNALPADLLKALPTTKNAFKNRLKDLTNRRVNLRDLRIAIKRLLSNNMAASAAFNLPRFPRFAQPRLVWTWVILRKKQRLRVFEDKVLRKILGAKRDEVTGEWRKLHNTELHALYSSPDIIRNIKSRRLRWTEHVALAKAAVDGGVSGANMPPLPWYFLKIKTRQVIFHFMKYDPRSEAAGADGPFRRYLSSSSMSLEPLLILALRCAVVDGRGGSVSLL
ncbi:hypothetical protein ANN_17935 [Periplaneta americana]|uniref:Uncharacterized protein n=1 Tax=Periplaneta americana TaxID=6978 RepID=A0ABQ8SME1_PERAM|nr:hypothetical protein ANN_17935 [Periplaneta americana]